MRQITTRISVVLFMIYGTVFGQQSELGNKKTKQSFTSHSPTSHHEIALEVLQASKDWIKHFNEGNADACVEGYANKALMSSSPFGIKKGKAEISEFWKPFIESGATDLVYTNIQIEVVNDSTSLLSANWSMNVCKGIIYQEKWEKIAGKWLLSYDDFEVIENFETPKKKTINLPQSHLVLENVIRASMEWIESFNKGNGLDCANGYSSDAFMNATPFASIQGREGIEEFWSGLITNGTGNLIYHNPIFKIQTNESVVLSSNWSMNIGEGKIYQEKWELTEGKWLLTYDEFEVQEQY